MINFRCPKCDDWLSVAESSAGAKETCPACGNVCIVPAPVQPVQGHTAAPLAEPQHSQSGPVSKPLMPDVLKAGIVLYIGAFLLSLASGLGGGSAEISEEQATSVVGMGCIALLLVLADIVGLVMACLGRAWGAILMACTTVIGFLFSLAYAASVPGTGGPLYWLSTIASLASLGCFIAPSAWAFYTECDKYRVGVKRE